MNFRCRKDFATKEAQNWFSSTYVQYMYVVYLSVLFFGIADSSPEKGPFKPPAVSTPIAGVGKRQGRVVSEEKIGSTPTGHLAQSASALTPPAPPRNGHTALHFENQPLEEEKSVLPRRTLHAYI